MGLLIPGGIIENKEDLFLHPLAVQFSPGTAVQFSPDIYRGRNE